MKVQHLFKTSNIAFVKISSQDDRSSLTTYANANGCKVKMKEGIWINPETCEVEKVTRVEIIGKLPERPERDSGRKEKYKIINDLRNRGLSMKEIAKRLNLSRARLYQIMLAEEKIGG